MKLRPLGINDLTFLLEVRNDKSTRYYLENDNVFSIKECTEWFLNTKPKWFIIEVEQSPVGYIRTNGNEVGCDIHPNFRRKGYARMAYKLYLKDKKYASLWVFEDNFAKNLYESLGFVQTNKSKNIKNRKYIYMEYNKK